MWLKCDVVKWWWYQLLDYLSELGRYGADSDAELPGFNNDIILALFQMF